MKDVFLSIGALGGFALTAIGLIFRYGPKDNVDAGALASFASVPFLVIGVPVLALCIIGLIK